MKEGQHLGLRVDARLASDLRALQRLLREPNMSQVVRAAVHLALRSFSRH